MLLIDDRENPGLAKQMIVHGVPVTVARLDFGDACWEGSGPGNQPVMIGVERKQITEIPQVMQDKRLTGHQLRGMWDTYDYVYLIIEGCWRPSESGGIELPRGSSWTPLYQSGAGITYRQVDAYLSSLEVRGNIFVVRSGSLRETAALYASRYHWWQKPFEHHHAHDQIYAPGPGANQARGKASLISRTPGLVEKVASQLPGIDRKAWEVAKRFHTAREFFEWIAFAGVREWESLPGVARDGAKIIIDAMDKEER